MADMVRGRARNRPAPVDPEIVKELEEVED